MIDLDRQKEDSCQVILEIEHLYKELHKKEQFLNGIYLKYKDVIIHPDNLKDFIFRNSIFDYVKDYLVGFHGITDVVLYDEELHQNEVDIYTIQSFAKVKSNIIDLEILLCEMCRYVLPYNSTIIYIKNICLFNCIDDGNFVYGFKIRIG